MGLEIAVGGSSIFQMLLRTVGLDVYHVSRIEVVGFRFGFGNNRDRFNVVT